MPTYPRRAYANGHRTEQTACHLAHERAVEVARRVQAAHVAHEDEPARVSLERAVVRVPHVLQRVVGFERGPVQEGRTHENQLASVDVQRALGGEVEGHALADRDALLLVEGAVVRAEKLAARVPVRVVSRDGFGDVALGAREKSSQKRGLVQRDAPRAVGVLGAGFRRQDGLAELGDERGVVRELVRVARRTRHGSRGRGAKWARVDDESARVGNFPASLKNDRRVQGDVVRPSGPRGGARGNISHVTSSHQN